MGAVAMLCTKNGNKVPEGTVWVVSVGWLGDRGDSQGQDNSQGQRTLLPR